MTVEGLERNLPADLHMSCWVVPSLAAELWGVSLEHVLEQIRSGAIRTKVDYGFVLIDVAPDSNAIAPPIARSTQPEAATWSPSSIVSEEELVLLNPPAADEMAVGSAGPSMEAVFSPSPVEPTAEELAWLGESPATPAAEVSVTVEQPLMPQEPGAGFVSSEFQGHSSGPVSVPAPIDVEAATPRSRRRRRPGRKLPSVPTLEILVPSESTVDEDEAGPDPNYGEVDDDRPLNWRQARMRASTTRRRPPPVRLAG